MRAFKRLASWLSEPKSDFVLLLVVLVLANLVASRAFFRVDLTSRQSFSLSEASRRVVKTLEEPLAVKVFFSSNLPAPYNGVERYLRDLLVEYQGVGKGRFSYRFFDMEKNENKDMAESYGISPVQIQEVKNDEVGVKNAYMGLAIVHGDSVEAVNNIVDAEGLEYRLTTTLAKVIVTNDALSGSTGPIQATLYASSSLAAFRIQGWSDLDKLVRESVDRVNKKNRGRLQYHFVDAATNTEIDGLGAKYGLQRISWGKQPNGMEAGSGALGIVLEYGDRSRTVPIELARGLFGGYGLVGLDDLEGRLSDALKGLVSNSLAVGYLTGHGEKDLYDDRNGAARFSWLVQDTYELKEVNLSKADIPAGITTLVINGPKEKLSELELYRIDQFLMRGGNVLALLDPYLEIGTQGGYGAPAYVPVKTGLEGLMAKYGVKLASNYVLDAECYVARQQGMGETPLYYAPLIGKKGLDKDHVVTRNLSNVLFLKAGEVSASVSAAGTGAAGGATAAGGAAPERSAVTLVSSSPDSWVVSGNINLMPFAMAEPAKDQRASHPLVVLVEGRFESGFDAAPPQASGGAVGALSAETRLARSVQRGKLIVAGTSELAGPSLLDENGRQPTALFIRNALDYLTGNEELNDMRTKGLSADSLAKTSPALRAAIKSMDMYGLPLIVAAAGLLAWRRRVRRRAKIQAIYASVTKTAED
jgi:ABC-type uncharacterized transport system involved in gliding motility auxiliary subunit